MKVLSSANPPRVVRIAILAVGLLAAGLGAVWKQEANKQDRLHRVAHFTEDFADRFVARFDTYRLGLLGARGLFGGASAGTGTPTMFAAYAQAQGTARDFPGVAGLGFARRVAAADEAAFVSSARKDGLTDYTVRQMTPHAGDRYLVQYVEPQDHKFSTVGLDLASEPNRRQAAEHAMESGKATLSAPISMVDSGGVTVPSFLLLLPMFAKGMPLDSAAHRVKAHIGWCYYTLDIAELLKSLGPAGLDMAVQITDVTQDGATIPLYRDPDFNRLGQSALSGSLRRKVFEREWLIETRAKPQFLADSLLDPSQLALGIAAFFSLLAALAHLMMRNGQRLAISSIAQNRLAAIIESSSDAIISADLDGKVRSWNKAAEAIFDFQEKDALGKSLIELIVPEELAQEDREFFNRVARGEQVPHFLTVRRTRLDSRIDVSVSVSPIRDNRGHIVGAAKTLRDVTQQKRNEQLFRLAVEAAPSAMLLVNQDQRITMVNRQSERLFGYERAELLGRSVSSLVPLPPPMQQPAGERGYMAALQASSEEGEQALFGLCKDGREVRIEVGLNPIEAPNGAFTLVSVVDISKRLQLETQLRSTYARLGMALESSGLGIWVMDIAHDTLTWDTRMREIYGVPPASGEGPLPYDFWSSRVHPQDVDAVTAQVRSCIAGTDQLEVVFRIVQDNGSVRHIQASGILEHNDKGEPVRVVGTSRDIADVKLAQERALQANALLEAQVEARTSELQHLNMTLESQVAERSRDLSRAMEMAVQANAAKLEFLANMSHEIRTPLNGILGLAYLLDKQDISPAVRSMAHKINSSGKLLLGNINDILDFSKIEAKHLQIEEVPFRLSDILDNLAVILCAAVGKKDLELVIGSAPSGADYLRGDPLRLGQVLLNLTSNAVKFTQEGEVVLAMERLPASTDDRRRLRFAVRDTGIGVPADKLERIFQPFSQADSSTTRTFGGTGLGLAISSQLVQLMGGALQVQSTPNVGSEFSFTLEFASSEPSRNATPELAHQSVLVVDDNETSGTVLQEAGRSLGWSVDVVHSGNEALELYRRSHQPHYDVLLVDWRMPGLSGLQTLEQLMPTVNNAVLPAVVMVTAYDRDELMADPLSRLADVVASKPMTASSIFNAVVQAKSQRGLLNSRPHLPSAGQKLAGIRVLVVDDSEINREVALDILVGEGASVDVARDGAEALTRLNSKPADYDVILMDVQMPVMDGYEATRQIRLQPALRQLPIIALTAGALRNQYETALQRGMDAFVPKPFDVDQLLDTIVQLVRHRTHGTSIAQSAGPETVAEISNTASETRVANAWRGEPVFDAERALRTWRNSEKLKRRLDGFVREHGADGARIQELLAAQNWPDVVRVAHKLRGAAGALSLLRCMGLAAAVEESAQSDPLQQQLAEWINHLPAVLRETLDAVDHYMRRHQPVPAGAERLSPSGVTATADDTADPGRALGSLLGQLRTAVDSDDPSQVEPHMPALARLLPRTSTAQLQSLLDDFDFEAIRQWIATIERDLEEAT